MKGYLISTLIALRSFQFNLAIIYIGLTALALRHADKDLEILRSKNLLRLATGLGVLVITVYLMFLVDYLLYPNFVDHFEATVASIAWLGIHGRALYPNWVTDDVYGIVYGPVLFLLHGSLLLIWPTPGVLKILGVTALLVAFVLFFIVIKQKVGNHVTSFIFIASLVMIFVPFGARAFWSRSEPFLILISALAFLVSVRLRPLAAGAIIGGLAGLAAGFKLHGFIYLMPMGVMILARVKILRDRGIIGIIGVASAVIFGLLPFTLKEASLVSYLQYVKLATDHGLALHTFITNLLFALVLCAPTGVIYFWRRPAIDPSEFWLLAGLCISIAIAIVIASVSGGGPYHLLPFVPICLYATIVVSGPPTAEASQIIAGIFLLLLLAFGPAGALLILYERRNFQVEQDKITELRTLLVAYPDAQIGITDDRHHSDTFYKIFSVLQGHELSVDFDSWEEMAYAGVSETNIIRFIEQCRVSTWLLPRGTPFTKLNDYTELPVLSDDFRQTFSMNYRLIQMGRYYQVWGCR